MGTRLAILVAFTSLAALAGQLAPATSAADPKPPGAKGGQPAPAARPDRPPDYYGAVERVRVRPAPAGRPEVWILLSGRRPPAGGPRPVNPLLAPDGKPDRVWVRLADATLEEDGAQLEDGSAAAVWTTGPVGTTEPAQVWATYIVAQPAAKE